MSAPTSARPPFTSRPGIVMAVIVLGGMAFAFSGEERAKKVASHEYKYHPKPVDHYHTGGSPHDALYAVARPAKNSNVKGSLPSASKWV